MLFASEHERPRFRYVLTFRGKHQGGLNSQYLGCKTNHSSTQDFWMWWGLSQRSTVAKTTQTQRRSRDLTRQSAHVLSSYGCFATLSGSSVHGVLQARILEWVAISSSKKQNGAYIKYNRLLRSQPRWHVMTRQGSHFCLCRLQHCSVTCQTVQINKQRKALLCFSYFIIQDIHKTISCQLKALWDI